jgi:hypothetical protein
MPPDERLLTFKVDGYVGFTVEFAFLNGSKEAAFHRAAAPSPNGRGAACQLRRDVAEPAPGETPTQRRYRQVPGCYQGQWMLLQESY